MSSIEALTGLVSAGIGLIGASIGAILRYTSGQQRQLRTQRARLDANEGYAFALRSQLRSHGIEPIAWPRLLTYLSDTGDPVNEGRRSDDAPG